MSIFYKTILYTIEFKKRGLPHVHILLFLHPDYKNPITTYINGIISVEVPDENVDLDAYNVVKSYMMYGLYNLANKSASYMVGNKYTKHLPKKFL